MASILKVDTIQDQSGNNIINENADTITIGASGDTITIPSGATLTNNGTQTGLTLSDNILFNTASKGIYLGVTSATASNLLDDYEEGTWTPVVVAGSISGTGITYTGKYVKIGNIVALTFSAEATSENLVVSSYVQFSGLPFTGTSAGTCAVMTEDPDIFSRQGFASIGPSRLSLSQCGSNPGTSTLRAGGIYLTS